MKEFHQFHHHPHSFIRRKEEQLSFTILSQPTEVKFRGRGVIRTREGEKKKNQIDAGFLALQLSRMPQLMVGRPLLDQVK